MNFTYQELFDKAWHAIHAQGKPAYIKETSLCMYRGPDGTSCAFGHLVPEKLRHLLKEDRGSDNQLTIPEIASYFDVQDISDVSFFRRLQLSHDRAAKYKDFMAEYCALMRDVAKEYDLVVPGGSDV